jgi:hypothetical protein
MRIRLAFILYRLPHVDFIRMKKDVLHIQLPQTLPLGHGYREYNMNCGCLDHRTKGIFIVDAIMLIESLCN